MTTAGDIGLERAKRRLAGYLRNTWEPHFDSVQQSSSKQGPPIMDTVILPELQSDLPFADFIDPLKATEIVSSKTFHEPAWRNKSRLRGFGTGIHKTVLPI